MKVKYPNFPPQNHNLSPEALGYGIISDNDANRGQKGYPVCELVFGHLQCVRVKDTGG